MPFALIGFFLAYYKITHNDYLPSAWSHYAPFNLNFGVWFLLFLILLCMIFARSAAMAFNRYIDEKFDKLNPRTAVREIPAVIIKKENALLFVIINCVLFIATTFFINKICFFLSI